MLLLNALQSSGLIILQFQLEFLKLSDFEKIANLTKARRFRINSHIACGYLFQRGVAFQVHWVESLVEQHLRSC